VQIGTSALNPTLPLIGSWASAFGGRPTKWLLAREHTFTIACCLAEELASLAVVGGALLG
jgi:hypothetical protein